VTQPEAALDAADDTPRRSAGRRLASVLILVGAVVIIFASTRVWARVVVPGIAGMPELTVSGRVAASSGVPIALAAAAGAFVLMTSQRTVRFLVGLGLFVGGAWVALNSIMVSQDTGAQLANAMRDSLGLFTSRSNLGALAFGASFGQARADLTPWPWVAAAGGLLVAVAGLIVMVRGWQWPGPAERFERSSETPSADVSASGSTSKDAAPARTWDALSRGEDPT
jgi:uncharacterized membrane protein (TIGR02234 family)